jgi:hypothetical protein
VRKPVTQECESHFGTVSDVPVDPANCLDADGVISCDNIVAVPASLLGPQIGVLLLGEEDTLTTAIHAAFDLDRRRTAQRPAYGRTERGSPRRKRSGGVMRDFFVGHVVDCTMPPVCYVRRPACS